MLKSRAITPTAQRASARPARGTAVVTQSHRQSSAALGALAAAVVLASAPMAFAESTEPSTSVTPTTVTSISFARVDARVTEKLRERDTNLEWKCKGISMYDCSGELQEAQEQRFEEMGKMLRSLTGGPTTPDTVESP
ncbi:hypothetical protein HXX76_002943 [Chlamydomonas incerta]|uniref:Uncharacterized protein n=1 Tax=Chlamydomonas incerta TaxID=51695 RepID=A0A835TLM5_CHLIN|nr:hypothetical protein HXX76_002943 [Chlamydomonas incerta]|eukprot:KAG2442864.1 hypothetical protein HXX76_002943 [Chlamydomonas incerta]